MLCSLISLERKIENIHDIKCVTVSQYLHLMAVKTFVKIAKKACTLFGIAILLFQFLL